MSLLTDLGQIDLISCELKIHELFDKFCAFVNYLKNYGTRITKLAKKQIIITSKTNYLFANIFNFEYCSLYIYAQ